MNLEKIHIGSLICNKLKEERRTAAWLAQKIHCERNNVYKIFKKSSIDTDLLLKINLALNTDFFACYSEFYRNMKNATDNVCCLKKDYPQNIPK